MQDDQTKLGEIISRAFSTERRARHGRGSCLEELARSDLRRFLDKAGFGWERRQAILREADIRIQTQRMDFERGRS